MEKFSDVLKFQNNKLYLVLKGFILSIIITMILFFILGTVLANTNLTESIINPAIIIISAISIFAGSSISTLKLNKKGLVFGAIIGFLYIFSLYIISGLMSKNMGISIYTFIMFASSIVAGGFGGIIGVNMK